VCGVRGRAQQVWRGESGEGQGAIQSVVGGTHTPAVLPAEPRGGRTTAKGVAITHFLGVEISYGIYPAAASLISLAKKTTMNHTTCS
jgi:hypothetical protein